MKHRYFDTTWSVALNERAGQREPGRRGPLLQYIYVIATNTGHFTMGVVKLIVSHYRYFLFTIYDTRFTQLIDIL